MASLARKNGIRVALTFGGEGAPAAAYKLPPAESSQQIEYATNMCRKICCPRAFNNDSTNKWGIKAPDCWRAQPQDYDPYSQQCCCAAPSG